MGEDERIVYIPVELPKLQITRRDYFRELRVNQWHRAFRGFLKALRDEERGKR